jgi:hypothetical protein
VPVATVTPELVVAAVSWALPPPQPVEELTVAVPSAPKALKIQSLALPVVRLLLIVPEVPPAEERTLSMSWGVPVSPFHSCRKAVLFAVLAVQVGAASPPAAFCQKT